jgi:hypothetical protein
VRCSRFPRHDRHVPIADARSTQRGIAVPFSRDEVRRSARLEHGPPSRKEGERLMIHYGGQPPVVAAAAPPDPGRAADERLERAVATARYHEDRLRLYRAKMHGSRPTSAQRLRELERANDNAQASLRVVRGEQPSSEPTG